MLCDFMVRSSISIITFLRVLVSVRHILLRLVMRLIR
uniref:Uncharacterized protein n=1 Tax=Brassica oleracea TaxID=3712 RepID=A0A3P6FMC6_BRAOL|nr:unnamed protein product [Brassica oleracea]